MDSLVFGQSFVGLTRIPCCYPSTPSNTGIQAKADREGSEPLQLLYCLLYIPFFYFVSRQFLSRFSLAIETFLFVKFSQALESPA